MKIEENARCLTARLTLASFFPLRTLLLFPARFFLYSMAFRHFNAAPEARPYFFVDLGNRRNAQSQLDRHWYEPLPRSRTKANLFSLNGGWILKINGDQRAVLNRGVSERK